MDASGQSKQLIAEIRKHKRFPKFLIGKRSSAGSQDLAPATSATSTAEKYRNRDGNQQTSADFDGRAASLRTRVFERRFDVSSRWHAEGQALDDDPLPNPAVLEIKAAALRARRSPDAPTAGARPWRPIPPRHAGHLSPPASPSLRLVLRTPGRLVSVGEVVPGNQGVGVVGAQDLLVFGEGALVQRDGLAQPSGRLVGAGKVVAGGQGAGVGVAQDPLAVGEGALEQRDGLGQPSGRLVGAARLSREVRVSGWASPRTRSRSARVRSNSGMASPSRPAAW